MIKRWLAYTHSIGEKRDVLVLKPIISADSLQAYINQFTEDFNAGFRKWFHIVEVNIDSATGAVTQETVAMQCREDQPPLEINLAAKPKPAVKKPRAPRKKVVINFGDPIPQGLVNDF